MIKITNIVAGLLGLVFLVFGLNFFLHFLPMPTPPEGSLAIPFFQATAGSGFLAFVKVFEIVGAFLVAFPQTRSWGVLILMPIILNILAFNLFIVGGMAVLQPPVVLVNVLGAYLIWADWSKYQGLLSNSQPNEAYAS